MQDRGPQIAAVMGLFVGLSWVFVSLRIGVRARITKSWKLDDSILVLALLVYTVYGAIGIQGVRWGTGRRLNEIKPEDLPKALEVWWYNEILYAATTLLIRLSISIFLLRLATRSAHKYVIYATQLIVIVFTIAYIILATRQCAPYDYFWKQYQGGKGSCLDINIVPNASIAQSVVGFIVDWTLGLLPIWIMSSAKLSSKVKLPITGVLSLGLLAGIATMIRIPFIKKLPITDNFLYATTDVAIWSTIEPGLGIIAFSIATLHPLLRSFFPSVFDSISAADQLSFGEDQPHDDFVSELPTYIYNYNYDMNTRHTKDSRASTFSSYTSTTYDSIRMMKDRKIRSTVTSITFSPPQEFEEDTNTRSRNGDTISVQSTTNPPDEIDYDDVMEIIEIPPSPRGRPHTPQSLTAPSSPRIPSSTHSMLARNESSTFTASPISLRSPSYASSFPRSPTLTESPLFFRSPAPSPLATSPRSSAFPASPVFPNSPPFLPEYDWLIMDRSRNMF